LALSYWKSKRVSAERCCLCQSCSSHALIESEGAAVGKVAGTGLFCNTRQQIFLTKIAATRSQAHSGAAGNYPVRVGPKTGAMVSSVNRETQGEGNPRSYFSAPFSLRFSDLTYLTRLTRPNSRSPAPKAFRVVVGPSALRSLCSLLLRLWRLEFFWSLEIGVWSFLLVSIRDLSFCPHLFAMLAPARLASPAWTFVPFC
jgi:hypothetical protein